MGPLQIARANVNALRKWVGAWLDVNPKGNTVKARDKEAIINQGESNTLLFS